jgi:hypothetical protein
MACHLPLIWSHIFVPLAGRFSCETKCFTFRIKWYQIKTSIRDAVMVVMYGPVFKRIIFKIECDGL